VADRTVGPQSSLNERFVAIEIVRQVLLLRYSLRVSQAVVKAINDTEHPIAALIRDSLANDAGMRDPAQVRKLQQMIDTINSMRAPAWEVGRQVAETHLLEFGEAEMEDQQDTFKFLGFPLLMPFGGFVVSSALSVPFLGRTVRQWFDDAKADDARRIERAIFIGVGAGEDPATVARRVVGSSTTKGRDGATQTSRNHADTVTRSALVHMAHMARTALYENNKTVVTYEQFVAVLDSRTTQLCRSLNGRRFPIGVGPRPPLHPNCRSMRLVVLPEKEGGPMWEPEVYDSWIRKQPWAVKLELLGATRAAQTRKGTVDLGAFVDYGSKPMTLKQVRASARRLMVAYN
jgi:SPP1 gp7 family putative phage head morphogenesis protein